MSEDVAHRGTTLRSLLRESFIQGQRSPLVIRMLKKVDIFSFIPVPKDDPVSTKQSLIGTTLLIILFLTYIIIDFYQFVVHNPPNAQNYYTKLDDQFYSLPRFAITFMNGANLNMSNSWDQYLNFTLAKQSKDKGKQYKPNVTLFVNNFTEQNQNQTNPDPIDWIDPSTKSFYNILRTSSEDMKAKGLLYSTFNATTAKIKVQLCNINNASKNCIQKQKIQKLCAGGRIFLFIQNILDTTDFSQEDQQNSIKFAIYNFFLQPYNYKRVTFNFQVVKTVVQPDFFFRFTQQKQTRLQIQSYIEQSSDVRLVVIQKEPIPIDMLGIQFQLSSQILNVRVTYKTLIDHISMWGAFWGVLFAIFAIIFLTYNRNKFYKKNPQWNKFNNKNLINEEQVQQQQLNQ